jgi:hypothetical protein
MVQFDFDFKKNSKKCKIKLFIAHLKKKKNTSNK